MKKKIAIVFLGQYLYDARCCNMIQSLVDKKHSVTIYNIGCNANTKNSSPQIKEVKLKIISTPFLKYIHWFLLVYKKLYKKSYDFIIAGDLYSLIPISLFRKKFEIIYDSREIYTQLAIHKKRIIKNYMLSVMEKVAIKKISKVMVTADSDKQYLRELYPNNHISYKTIYNYPNRTYIKLNSSFLKKKFNIPNQCLVLLYQGVIQPDRGIRQTLKIIRSTKNTAAIIVGNGSYKKQLKEFAYDLKICSRVFWMEAVPYIDLLQITSGADIGVALIQPSSISNTFALPNKLFEYALSGIPTLASDIPNIKKYINKYSLGWCIQPSDLSQQVKIIEQYQKNKAIKKGLSFVRPFSLSWEFQSKIFCNFILDG